MTERELRDKVRAIIETMDYALSIDDLEKAADLLPDLLVAMTRYQHMHDLNEWRALCFKKN